MPLRSCYNKDRDLTLLDAGNRAVVQVFEGTSGIDVKKVYIIPCVQNASVLTPLRRKSSSQGTV